MPDEIVSAAPDAVESSAPETESNVSTETDGLEPAAKPVPATASTAPTQKKTETPAQKAEAARRYKLKVDGNDEDYDEESLIKLAQMGRASNKRFQEAAAARKQAEDFIAELKRNPRAVLSNPAIGVDIKKFAEDYLLEEIQKQELSPEQLRIQELEGQLKSKTDEEEAYKEQQKKADFDKLQQHYAEDYEKKITASIASEGLPKTPYTVERMAKYLSTALNNKIDLEPAHVAKLVKQDYMNEIRTLIGQADADTLQQLLGDDVANKIRKSDLAKLKAGQLKPIAPVEEQPLENASDLKPGERKTMSTHEYREYMEKMRGK